MNYVEHKKQASKDIDGLDILFAFSGEQLSSGLKKLGVSSDELIPVSCGGYIRKSDKQKYIDTFEGIQDRFRKLIENDKEGDGFIKSMFRYELANHEYGYTYELEDTLDALDFTYEDILANSALENGLSKALEVYQ